MHRRHRHVQFPPYRTQAHASFLQGENFLGSLVQGFWPTKPDALGPRRREADIHPVPDEVALELAHRLEDIELEFSTRVVAACVDALRGTDKWYTQPGHFVHEQAQVREAASEPVKLVNNNPLHPASAEFRDHPVQFW